MISDAQVEAACRSFWAAALKSELLHNFKDSEGWQQMRSALEAAERAAPLCEQPLAWWAETGTAGVSEGCNKPFWLKHHAIQYVRNHGGYIKPLYSPFPTPPEAP